MKLKLYLFFISYFAREDAYSTYPPFGYVLQHPYNQQFLPQMPHQYYGPAMGSSVQIMASCLLIPLPIWLRLPSFWIHLRQQIKIVECKGEKIGGATQLFGENEDKLWYKAFNSPEWKSIARQLHKRCTREGGK